MKATRIFALLAAVAVCLTPAFANEADVDKNVTLTQSMFLEKHTAPAWLLEDLSAYPEKTITLEGEFYNVSFTGATAWQKPNEQIRYNYDIKRIKTGLAPFNNAVGEVTPKYVLEVPQENYPGLMTITLVDSSFMPTGEVHVYRYVDDLTFEIVEKNIVVGEKGEVSFTIGQGGKYLVSSREVAQKMDRFTFERPVLHNPDELLTFLNQDSRYDFSQMITRRSTDTAAKPKSEQ